MVPPKPAVATKVVRGPDPQKHKKGDNQMEWFFVGRFESMGFGYDEYTNEDNTKCRQVWDDGYEEIFEIS